MTTFTPTQVMMCEVEYSLEEFWADLCPFIASTCPTFSGEKLDRYQHLVYQILYFAFNENAQEQGDKQLKEQLHLPEGLAEGILEFYKEDFEMLKSIIMGMFLRNLRESFGILSDAQNIRLVNARLKLFHSKYNL